MENNPRRLLPERLLRLRLQIPFIENTGPKFQGGVVNSERVMLDGLFNWGDNLL